MKQSWGQKRGLFLKFVADLPRQKTRKTRIEFSIDLLCCVNNKISGFTINFSGEGVKP
jgi:hypothetical protein